MAQALYTFKYELEPLLLPGQTAHIIKADGELDVQCVAIGPLPAYVHSFGSVAAGDWLRDKEISDLEMPPMEMAQLRFKVLDDVRVYLKNPAAVEQWRTAKVQFFIPQWPPEEEIRRFYWSASEHFVWEDELPQYDVYNPGASAVTARIELAGIRYRFRRIDTRGVMIIWVNSWPAGR